MMTKVMKNPFLRTCYSSIQQSKRAVFPCVLVLGLVSGCAVKAAQQNPTVGKPCPQPTNASVEVAKEVASQNVSPAGQKPLSQSTERLIANTMSRFEIPGMSIGLIKKGKLVWTGGYGYSTLSSKTKADGDTLYLVASVSKTITTIAALQAMEAGKLELNKDVSTYLPFAVRHPDYAKKPITTHMLLTHTSSLDDDDDVLDKYYTYGGDPRVSLEQFVRDVFVPPPNSHQTEDFFLDEKPATEYNYSNTGFALAGYLVQRTTKQSFMTFTKEHIFKPLKMNQTSWRLSDLPKQKIATLYSSEENDELQPIQSYTLSDYPNGGLRTSTRQLANFLTMVIHNGEFEGKRLLKPETIASMKKVQHEDLDDEQALGFAYAEVGEHKLFGHQGDETGAAADMFYEPKTGNGVILLINTDRPETPMYSALYEKILEEADRF
jgi:CubicO group peptidase (beta-lactamase class C family)